MMDSLSDAAQAVYRALRHDSMPADGEAMALEAARIKDRLDKLDVMLSGGADEWLTVVDGDSEGELVLKIDGAMQEARQLATVFRQMLAEIERRWPQDGGGEDDDDLANL